MDEGTIDPLAPVGTQDPTPAGLSPAPEDLLAPTRAGRRWIVVIVAAVVGLIAAGAVAAFFVLRGSGEMLLDAVPADADAVVAAYLDPAASQKVNLLRMVERFPELGDEAQLQERVDETLDDLLEGTGLTHQDLGWVGDEVAIWFDVESGSADGAVLVHSSDREAAERAMEKVLDTAGGEPISSDHLGVTVWSVDDGALALVDDVVILGSDDVAVEQTVDVMRGEEAALDTSEEFLEITQTLPEAKLILGYVDVGQVLEGLEGLVPPDVAGSPLSAGQASRMAFVVVAEDDGIALEAVQANDTEAMDPALVEALNEPPHANTTLPLVPADAYGVFAMEQLEAFETALASVQDTDPELAAQMEELGITGPDGIVASVTGDLAFEASPDPSGPVGGAVLIGVEDEERWLRFLEENLGGLPETAIVEEDHAGTTIWALQARGGGPVFPFPASWAVVDGILVVGTSPEHVGRIVETAAEGAGGLAADGGFTQAFPNPDLDTLMYVDTPAILAAIRQQFPPEDLTIFDEDVGRYWDPVGYVAASSDGDATSNRSRVFVQVP